MGKAKKKLDKKDYEDDENHIDTEKRTEDVDVSSKAKKKEKKSNKAPVVDSESDDDSIEQKKKSKQKNKSNIVDDTAENLKDLSISKGTKKDKKKKGSVEEDDDDGDEQVGQRRKEGGFAMLAQSDDEDSEPPSENEEEPPEVPVTKPAPGGKKSKRKKKDDDDDDLEKILAELKMEYTGEGGEEEAGVAAAEAASAQADEDEAKRKKKEKKKRQKEEAERKKQEKETEAGEDGEEGPTLKSAAQKRKEKKEREKQKRQDDRKQQKTEVKKAEDEVEEEEAVEEPPAQELAEDSDQDDDKKKKKKKKGAKETKEDKDKAKGVPNKKTIAAMQEALKKIKEEEEKAKKEEEERVKKEEEAERQYQEQLRLEQERKDKKKAKEKERKERLKAEGRLLTAKQRADKARAEAMIEAMRAKYAQIPVKPATQTSVEQKKEVAKTEEVVVKPKVEEPVVPAEPKVEEPPAPPVEEEEDDNVKDAWDADSDQEESPAPPPVTTKAEKKENAMKDSNASKRDESEDDSDSDDSGDGSDESSSEESDHEKKTDAEQRRLKVIARIKTRQEEAEKKRTVDELRAAVVCVLGHVDTGKTKILDKLRRTNVQDSEAGGITQQIGATNVPIDAIKEQTRHVKGFSQVELRVPGLLIIDTPGHESFSNLRSRGSSLCDIAILVVDIMHGLEPQTIESLNLLKQRKTPFLVALNKIDRLYDWQTMNKKDIRDIIKGQASNTQLEFEQRAKEVILQFAEQGMNAALFYDNPDSRSYVNLVPTSAITGEGMGNLLGLVVESCQALLAKRLAFSEELQATVLEVKAVPGLGTTIDVILVNGHLREGDTVVLAGTDQPIVTQIRSLLMPQPLKELRVKNAYVEFKEVKAAQGIKIAAKDLEKVIAGLNLRVAEKPDEVEILKEEVGRELRSALSSIRLQERGVYVQASTLGSLEALLEFLKASSIPYSNIRIGPVVKKDVMKASTMLEHDSQYATILAFDVKVERDAQELADTLGVRIFQADIIYHLFDKFMAYREELRRRKREEFRTIAVFPCKLRILPQFVFNSRDPIVVGVIVEAGIVKEGTPLCVPTKEFVDIGIVTSIQVNHKTQETARKGQEVCLKIEPIPGETPKMFGRHFDEEDLLVSKISRASIDACKDHFREDLAKTDWQLIVELKKLFQIL